MGYASAMSLRLFRFLLPLLALLCLGASPPPTLPVVQKTLPNGLTLLLSRDDRLPVVAVEVRYLVGSAHERQGRSGFAHLFEHLMFQGSRSFDREYFEAFEKVGGAVNGTTNTDRTNYFERVPKNYLELCLWMESDRMEGLLDVLTRTKLDNQRDVVKNERRQRYENTPYGMAWKLLGEQLHPVGHPYHHPTIGSHEDLSAASLDDVKAFFAQHYVPANAVLTIVGDFDEAEAVKLATRYFGHLPGGQRTPWPSVAAPTPKAAHVVDRDEVPLPRIHLAWHTPAVYADGDAAMDVLASVLSQGKSSRLYRPLVYEKRVAKDVEAFQASRALGSMFVVQATAAPGVGIDELARELDGALRQALATPPTDDEMERALNHWRKSFFGMVESTLSRAQLLSSYFHVLGEADWIAQDLKRYTELKPADVAAQAARWLIVEQAVRVDVVPVDAAAGGEVKP
jgi:zinc protease